uniref:Uncharacterized protein n=1 Tax=Setaria viridis TaxID=4556 RepID=A0A4U6U6U0_SETVI|nr:hypothetical protein SEVIR_6G070375v2 [Setaria viridis]
MLEGALICSRFGFGSECPWVDLPASVSIHGIETMLVPRSIMCGSMCGPFVAIRIGATGPTQTSLMFSRSTRWNGNRMTVSSLAISSFHRRATETESCGGARPQ